MQTESGGSENSSMEDDAETSGSSMAGNTDQENGNMIEESAGTAENTGDVPENTEIGETDNSAYKDSASQEEKVYPAWDFELVDQYGASHRISDYKGHIVFLNFWATWCPPCRAEMPYIEELYEEYLKKGDDSVVFLSIAFPGYGSETSESGIMDFLDENGYMYPVLMDAEAQTMIDYGVTAYPTTYMIDEEGNIYGYVTGSMTKEVMEEVIEQTKQH